MTLGNLRSQLLGGRLAWWQGRAWFARPVRVGFPSELGASLNQDWAVERRSVELSAPVLG